MNPLIKYPKLLRNAVRCLKCKSVIESLHVHDFVSCRCGTICVDGGLEYERKVGLFVDENGKPTYENLSEYDPEYGCPCRCGKLYKEHEGKT